jgi:hypothetical protein
MKTCENLTGVYLEIDKLATGQCSIPKESFSGTAQYLQGYTGKWHIEVKQSKVKPDGESYSPFDIAVHYTGHGYWVNPAEVYLVLEDIKE